MMQQSCNKRSPMRIVVSISLAIGVVMMLLVSLWLSVSFEGATVLADSQALYVATTGSDTTSCQDSSAPCVTIGYALTQARDNDEVRIAEGTYTENLTIDTALSLMGGYEAAGWTRDLALHETIIDGSDAEIVAGDWDGSRVQKPTVIKDGSEYKMWYDGGDLMGDVKVGFAYSTDGTAWTKDGNNPVLGPVPDSWESDTNTEFGSFVLYEDDLYKMWYEHSQDGLRQLGYATSADGMVWARHPDNPVLAVGPDGFDQDAVAHGTLINDSGIYKLWYHAVGDQGVIIAYATSPDGINWTKQGPALIPGDGTWDEFALWGPSVLKRGDTYWMWYSGAGPTGPPAIGVVTSTNGITWTRQITSPVLSEEGVIGDPSVIEDGGTLRMWYNNFDEGAIKLAESSDGLNWTPVDENPVLTPGEAGEWGGAAVSFVDGSDGSVLEGLTITGGRGDEAGGVSAGDSGVFIRNCLIRENWANGMPHHYGGGGVGGNDLTIEDSIIIQNEVGGGAGGIRSGGQISLVNTLVADNRGDAGVHANGSVSMMNSTIVRNDGGVLFNPEGDQTLDVTNSIIYGNEWSINEDAGGTINITYSDIQGGWPGEGNINADPQFIDPEIADYHVEAWSPTIDSGTASGAPDHDLDGNDRPLNDGFDMGAYEFTGAPIPNEGNRYVAVSGSDDGPNLCFDSTTPCASIGHAVHLAQDGEAILVETGTFDENLEFSGKEISVRGGFTMTEPDWLPDSGETIIDGDFTGRTVLVHDGTDLVLENLTIIGGSAPDDACWGGGVQVTNGNLAIRKSIIRDNKAMCNDGQMFVGAGGGLNAIADEGPALLLVEDSYILDNEAGDHGSALGTDGVTVVFTNVVASGNTSNVLGIHNTDFRMVNSTVAENNEDGSVLLDFDSDSNISVLNSILWSSGSVACGSGGGNCDITYSDVQGNWPGEGNLNHYPLFVDSTAGDFHLISVSPLIDAGSASGAPAQDIEGTVRDSMPDMGAYEWSGETIFLPLMMWPLQEGGVNRLIGHWNCSLTDFDTSDAPLVMVFNSFQLNSSSTNTYVGAGYAAFGENAVLAPMAAQAVDKGAGVYVMTIQGTSVIEGEAQVFELAGTMDVDPADIAQHLGNGTWRTDDGTGECLCGHADRSAEQGPPVNTIPGLFIEGPLVTSIVDCDGYSCRTSTDFDLYTNVASAGANVVPPDSSAVELDPYTDIFSPGVNFVDEFRFSNRIDGTPSTEPTYTFHLFDPLGVRIPGASVDETWSGCAIEPPRNHVATPPGGTSTSITLSWSAVVNADDYQVEIGNDNGVVYGGGEVKTTSHVIPWAGFGGDAPGSPDGRDIGKSLDQLAEGEYHIQVGSTTNDCSAADHGAELYFRKEGNTITFFDPEN